MRDEPINIVDRYGRIHDYLRISLTERCNLRCFYCMPEEGIQLRDKSEFMSTEELISIAQTFVSMGVTKIRLTGGEPFVRKGIDKLIHTLGELPIELAITTNAILIDKYIPDLIKAGVKNINVSLDSLQEERFNRISRRSFYQKIKENIGLLLQHGFNLKINVVLMKGLNDDEIIDFIEWTRREPVQVRFIEFMPFSGNNWKIEKKVSLEEILETVYSYYGDEDVIKCVDAKNDTSKNYKIKNALGGFGIISSVTNPFCASCNRIRLTADGKIKNCLFSQSESDLLSTLRVGGDVKNVIRETIQGKHKVRGGFDEFSEDQVKKMNNRTMIAIGG